MGDSLKDQLRRHEGFRSKPYRCPAGKLTIGYGRNLDASGISRQEGEYMLDNDINRVIGELHKEIPWFGSLDFVRQDVLTNMAYNLGTEGLLKWKNTLEDIKEGRYDKAADRMELSLWAGQVGDRAKELSNQMRTGRYRDEQ